jgi:hypothetical protein
MSVADGVLLLRGSGKLAQLMAGSFNEVNDGYKHLYKITDYEWNMLNIAKLLRIMSSRCNIPDEADRENLTNRDMVNWWMEKYFTYVDYDPEVLWDDTDIDGAFDRDKFDSKEFQMFMNL